MLDCEILKTNYGVSYGSVTLKSLQNDNIPELDLLVREAIQNSSDASLSLPGESFTVNFSTGNFVPKELNELLTGIEADLNYRFPQTSAKYLEIRDIKTSGLTGVIKKSELKTEDHGNFFKLIFDTGKRQTQKDAGGNWGFGKSVYYRVGIGIVIFYSQIKLSDGTYESRLIITLVEDESKKNDDGSDATILGKVEPLSAGKAWWGIREGDDLLPIRDSEFTDLVLNVFNLKPFGPTETGTSIIIPYIDSKYLLDNIIPVGTEAKEGVLENFKSTWGDSIEDYLKLAIQKWYAPKIHNRELKNFCKKKWLLVTINNKPIKRQDMLPFFQMVQELFTTSIAKTYGYDYKSLLTWMPEIQCCAVNIQKYLEGKTSGYVSIVRITEDALSQGQLVLSPYDYVGRFEADGGLNEPIVMYARDPGMVIDYPIAGPWVKNISPPASNKEFIFAFYVPVTEKKLRSDLPIPEYAGITLGEYLRSCEASDHMEWIDPAKMQLVARIQKNTINQIVKETTKVDLSQIDASASKLSGKLGRKLLPLKGYGHQKGGGGNGSGSGGSAKINNLTLEILSQSTSESEITLEYQLNFMHSKKEAQIEIIIDSESGWIDPESWKNDIGTRFPAVLKQFEIDEYRTGVSTEDFKLNGICSNESPVYENGIFQTELVKVGGTSDYCTIKVSSQVFNLKLHGYFTIKARDKKYRYSFKVS